MRSLTFLLLIQLFKANSPLKSTTIWFPTNDANVDRYITHFISSYKQCYMVDNSISLSLPDLLRDQQLCRTALLNMISQGMAEIIWENIENYDDLNFNSARHPTKY
uniref:Putative secreted protein n=1 Tax=Ixodes scapularis TaxID=6945 RepID=A0A4D5RB55_IXOSC